MLSILADINIPYAEEAFASAGKVNLLNAESITPKTCLGVDVLLVRSVTQVNETLLKNSPVMFVGSATAGVDHIDQPYLQNRGIPFVYAPGANADSVVEYVLTALIQLSALQTRSLEGLTLGIVGCGHIGGRLAIRSPAFGLNVLKNDPPLAKQGRAGFTDLETVLTESDIVTLHVPKAPDTCHLVGETELRCMKPGAWILNTSRGNVIDSQALKRALTAGRVESAVLDVWEHEPTPDLELLQRVTLGTPHIAGHSVDGKLRGTIMLYNAVIKHFGIRPQWDYEQVLRENLPDPITIPPETKNWLAAVAQRLYDIESDDARMRSSLAVHQNQTAQAFRRLRRFYPPRRTFHRHRITEIPAPHLQAVRDGLCTG